MLTIILKDIHNEHDKMEIFKAIKKAVGKEFAESAGDQFRFTIEPINSSRAMIMMGERNDNDLSFEVSIKDIDQLT